MKRSLPRSKEKEKVLVQTKRPNKLIDSLFFSCFILEYSPYGFFRRQIDTEILIMITIWTVSLFYLCVCVNWLISIGHLLSTKDRRICLFFACHLSSLTSTRLATTCLFNVPSFQAMTIDWKSTLNRYLLGELLFSFDFFILSIVSKKKKEKELASYVINMQMNNCWLNFNCSHSARMKGTESSLRVQWDISLRCKKEACVYAFF